MPEHIKLKEVTPADKKFATTIKKMPKNTLSQRVARLEKIIKHLTQKTGNPLL